MIVDTHKDDSVQDLVRRANLGEAQACAKLGHIYASGDPHMGIAADPALASQYYEKGAGTGDPACMLGLANLLLPDNPQRAIALLEDCAKQQYLLALVLLGDFYLRGRYVPQDPHKAFLYLQEYSALCRPGKIAQGTFAVRWDIVLYPLCLFFGVGCGKDEQRARTVLAELADLGNLTARDIIRTGKLSDPMVGARFHLDIKSNGPAFLFDPTGDPSREGGFAGDPRLHGHHETVDERQLSDFLRKALIPGEAVLMRAQFPRIYTVDTFLRLFFYIFVGYWIVHMEEVHQKELLALLPERFFLLLYKWRDLPLYVMSGFGVLVFMARMVKKWTTEIVLTEKRFLYRRGLFAISMIQMNFWQVEHTDVTQSMLGNFLDYGHVLIQSNVLRAQEDSSDAKGILSLPLISHPYMFTRLIEDNRRLPYRGGNIGMSGPLPPQ